MIHIITSIIATTTISLGTFLWGNGKIGSLFTGLIVATIIHLAAIKIAHIKQMDEDRKVKAFQVTFQGIIIFLFSGAVLLGILRGAMGAFYFGILTGIIAILLSDIFSGETSNIAGGNILTFLAGGLIGGAISNLFQTGNGGIVIGIIIGVIFGAILGKVITSALVVACLSFIIGGLFSGLVSWGVAPKSIYFAWTGLGLAYLSFLIVRCAPFCLQKLGLYNFAEKVFHNIYRLGMDDEARILYQIKKMYDKAGKLKQADRTDIQLSRILEKLDDELLSKDRLVQDATIERLTQIGEPSGDILIKNLTNPDRRIRLESARVLGLLKNSYAVKSLCKRLLEDNDEEVRKEAAQSLGKIKTTEAVVPLIESLKDKDTRVRWKSAEALGEIGSELALGQLMTALQIDSQIVVRRKAAEALGKIGKIAAIEPLMWAKDNINEDHTVRNAAEKALQRIRRG